MKKQSKKIKRTIRRRPNPETPSFKELLNLFVANHTVIGISFKYGSIFGQLRFVDSEADRFEILNNYLDDGCPQINFSFMVSDVINIVDSKSFVKSRSFLGKEWVIVLAK